MAIRKGRVVTKQYVIRVGGEEHFIPKGCDPILEPQLEAIANKDVEVLMARGTVIAMRPEDKELRVKFPIITGCNPK